MTIHYHATACAGTDDHPKHHLGPGGRAIGRLGHGKAVGIISQSHLSPQCFAQIQVKRLADKAGGIGILHQPGGRGDRTRDANPNAALFTQMRLNPLHQGDNRGQCGLIIPLRGHHPPSLKHLAGIGKCNPLYLGATQVYPYPHFSSGLYKLFVYRLNWKSAIRMLSLESMGLVIFISRRVRNDHRI